MFKFNFSPTCLNDQNAGYNLESNKNVKTWTDCKKLMPQKHNLYTNILSNVKFKTIPVNDLEIKYVCSTEILQFLQKAEHPYDISVLKAEENHSDLLPAVYEGGIKIWECTYDVLKYFDLNKIEFENKSVLDLGCGSGILGIYTLAKGSTCCFQDYNMDVLEYITIPNVLLNSKDYLNKCMFYFGDWMSFSNVLECSNDIKDNKFDVIITSETIYNTENYAKLHKVFERLLKKNGSIYLAAKSFYFGVGGSISSFEEFMDKNEIFRYSCCWKCVEGVKREILKIEFI
ncbi:hypothetical protein NQ315_015146 [Exocentrus adspersus]|uniref:protein-histidine N-methyltransferase n=1 Tax=Exocentrus adspersus TaxID=1586481 RepID=A0AAV8VES6_9CUCU|nr:hypothetical protein NQ315_015146 [Exocentrus adspersus]